jgi:hypothetical protein
MKVMLLFSGMTCVSPVAHSAKAVYWSSLELGVIHITSSGVKHCIVYVTSKRGHNQLHQVWRLVGSRRISI